MEAQVHWLLPTRVAFRALLVYFALYVLPFPLDSALFSAPIQLAAKWGWVPAGWSLGGMVDDGWKSVAVWVGKNLLGKEEVFVGPTGSGDTTVNYIKLGLMTLATGVIVAVWSVLDHRRPAYPRLARWLVVACRYYLGLVLLGYGYVKLIPLQMTMPGFQRLLMPFGDISPMGLVWRFMGVSTAYTIISGLCEVIGGWLLFFRRTRLVGALFSAAVMTNVVLLNYCYDVPVKLFSSHLLAMCIGLILLDAGRLWNFFLAHQPVPAPVEPPLFARRWQNIAGKAFGLLMVLYATGFSLYGGWQSYHSFGAGRELPPLYGLHEVESFVRDGEEAPPLVTDESRWQALLFERSGWVTARRMDGVFEGYPLEIDTEARTLTVRPRTPPPGPDDPAPPEVPEPLGELTYEQPEDRVLVVRGTWKGSEVEVRMTTRTHADFELTGRGFHWIAERPYHR